MNNKLYVGNLSYEATESEIQSLFAQAGTVQTVSIVRDRDTGRARGFGFVEMATDAEAQAAIDQLDQRPFGGRNLTVNVAKPMAARTNGGFGSRRKSEPRW
jgi:cold-inducible RNA-binding protein